MPEIIDISVPLKDGIPTWPGSRGYSRQEVLSHEKGDGVAVSVLRMDVHTGTHIDAPKHFLESGATVDSLELAHLVGNAWVADVGDRKEITADVLESLEIPPNCRRLLLKSSNSTLWEDGVFHEDYAALTLDGAARIVELGIFLVGIDFLSIQRFFDGPETHEILLRAGVIILEGLNLGAVSEGAYELLCLPLSIPDAEGAPARAVLRRVTQNHDDLGTGRLLSP